jgi:hypothetical protein
MTSLETKLVMLKELQAKMKRVEAEIKAEWSADAIPGDRKTAAVKVDGKPLKLGSVTYTNGRSGHKVTDQGKFVAWALEAHPEVVEQVPTVPDWFTKNICDSEGFDPETGAEVPGVSLVEGSPFASVRPDKEAGENIASLLRSGELSWNEVLELER